jgi:ribosomal protein S18 acetylase RimI-like enzyme
MRIAPASDLEEVREIMREYATSTGLDLEFQGFEAELASLETFYEAIFVARCHPEQSEGPSPAHRGRSFAVSAAQDDTLAGCVALRDLGDGICEMKRLYVRPSYRGHDLGRKLALRVIDEARQRGYRAMRLDTLPSMQQAMSLYESLGFRDIEPYRFNPIEGSRFMELKLRA